MTGAFDKIWPYAHWFESMGLAGSGPDSNRIPRGRVWVKPEQDEVIIITEAGLGGLMGRSDFTFAPEYVVEAILQTFPQLRDFNIVDDIPSNLVTASVPEKGTLDPKKRTDSFEKFLRGYTLLWAVWRARSSFPSMTRLTPTGFPTSAFPIVVLSSTAFQGDEQIL